MSESGKIALIIGMTTLVIGGGGIAIYLATREPAATPTGGNGSGTGVGTGSSNGDNKAQQTLQNITDTANTATGTAKALGEFAGTLSSLFGKNKKESLPENVEKLASGKTLKAKYENKNDKSLRYEFTDGTLVDVLTNGKAEITTDSNWQDDYTKLSAIGAYGNETDMMYANGLKHNRAFENYAKGLSESLQAGNKKKKNLFRKTTASKKINAEGDEKKMFINKYGVVEFA